MSPRQRKASKKMIGVYLEEKDIRRFKLACEKSGVTMTEYLSEQIKKKVKDYDKQQSEQSNAGTASGNVLQIGDDSSGTKQDD